MEEKPLQEILNKLKTLNFKEKFDLVVGIGKGGIVPAYIVSEFLALPLEIIWLNLRDESHREIREEPELIKEISFNPKSKTILLVDDVSRTGKTFEKAKSLMHNARTVKTLAVNGRADYSLFDEDCFRMPWNLS